MDLSPSKKQSSSGASHVADLVDLHTFVAEHGDVSHGAVKSETLMCGVVGDQARRGQPVAKPLTQSVRHRDREHDQHSEMLARVKEFDGDNDKLLVEYEQDTDTDADTDMDMDTESDQPGEFNHDLKDCVDELRRVPRRVLRRESLRESLRAWLRVQVRLRESLQGSFRVRVRVCIQVCLHAERGCCVRALRNQLRVDSRDCERMRVQMAHTTGALNKTNASADSAALHTPRKVTTDAAQTKQFNLWPWRNANQGTETKRESAGNTCWCKT